MKMMIAIPCLDMVHTMFMESLLSLKRPSDSVIVTARSSLVYDSRNMLSHMAIFERYDRVLWLDSDMTFSPDLLSKLNSDLDEGYGFVSALCFSRKQPIKPIIYSETGFRDAGDGDGRMETYSKCIEEYPSGQIIEVKGIGLAATMMETSVIKEVYDKFGSPFSPIPGFGEDISFCRKCDELGIKMYCDTRIKVGHIAQTVIDEAAYLEGRTL